jgi:hypothetical protein
MYTVNLPDGKKLTDVGLSFIVVPEAEYAPAKNLPKAKKAKVV